MITSITIQNQMNQKFENFHTDPNNPLADIKSINYMVEMLDREIKFHQKIHAMVSELNSDLYTTNITAIVEKHFGYKPRITQKTKTTRSYFVGGLYIHEKDLTQSQLDDMAERAFYKSHPELNP